MKSRIRKTYFVLVLVLDVVLRVVDDVLRTKEEVLREVVDVLRVLLRWDEGESRSRVSAHERSGKIKKKECFQDTGLLVDEETAFVVAEEVFGEVVARLS